MSTKKTVEETVREIIARNFIIDKKYINKKSSFIDDLAATKIDMLKLFLSFEQEFNQKLFDENVKRFKTVGKLTKYIKSKVHHV